LFGNAVIHDAFLDLGENVVHIFDGALANLGNAGAVQVHKDVLDI
jgi:hypothetical protein